MSANSEIANEIVATCIRAGFQGFEHSARFSRLVGDFVGKGSDAA